MAIRATPQLKISAHDPRRERRRRLLLTLGWAASLALVYVWCKLTMTPDYFRTQSELAKARSGLEQAQMEIESLKMEVARLERADQVAQQARTVLDASLAESRAQLASLRGELSFYEKIVSGGADQAGLEINALHLAPTENPRLFRFVVTLSQNLKKDRVAQGRLKLAVSGVQGKQLRRLDYADLAGGADATELDFEFKYFQRIEGTMMLPEDFAPDQVRIEADGEGGSGRASREFAWSDGLKASSTG